MTLKQQIQRWQNEAYRVHRNVHIIDIYDNYHILSGEKKILKNGPQMAKLDNYEEM